MNRIILISLIFSFSLFYVYKYFIDYDGKIHTIDAVIINLFLFILFFSLSLLIFKIKHNFYKNLKFKIKFILINTLIIFILLESLLRLYATYSNDKAFAINNAPFNYISNKFRNNLTQYTIHPYLGYALQPNWKSKYGNYHNSLGYRGNDFNKTKSVDTYRIVCIGGSTTYCTGVEQVTDSYPVLLQQYLNLNNKLNFEVINAGVSNADTWYSLVNYIFKVQYLNPDMIIIYHGDNDLETRFVYPYNRFKSDNTGRISSATNIIMNQSYYNHSFLFRVLGNNSSFFRYFTGKIYPYSSLSSLFSSNHYYYDKFIFSLNNDSKFNDKFWIEMLNKNTLKYTRSNLENLVKLCISNNTKVVFSSFVYTPITDETKSLPYQIGISEHNILTEEIASEYQVSFFDLAEVFPKNNSYWRQDGIHFSPTGNQVRSQLTAEFILKNSLF